jgi:hypothetical protein
VNKLIFKKLSVLYYIAASKQIKYMVYYTILGEETEEKQNERQNSWYLEPSVCSIRINNVNHRIKCKCMECRNMETENWLVCRCIEHFYKVKHC